ncbi:MAG: VIT1/CCC1 transporter family protein [Nitrolancea sp.]
MSDPRAYADDAHRTKLINALTENLSAERRSATTYRYFAEVEPDPHRKQILSRLADAEERHAEKWRARLIELGVEPSEEPVTIPRVVRMRAKTDLNAALREAESIENDHLRHYEAEAVSLNDPGSAQTMREIAQDEAKHATTLRGLTSVAPRNTAPRSRLDSLLKGERHVSSGTWIADAIYGANDGLGAVFGLVAGVAGGAASSHFILLAGIAGAVASAVSMGSGAYLAAKSEREVHEAEMAREHREIAEDPEEEREELSLFYQLKGLTEDEANMLAARISQDEAQFLKVMASEELGLSEERLPKPLTSATSAMISTGLGAIVPVLPFFFTAGNPAIIAAAVVSLIGHFAVGAAKSLVTIRSWWSSGLEMTLIGVIVGVVTYAVGFLVGVG